MKKIIAAIMIVVSLLSCEDGCSIDAASQIEWTQVPDFTRDVSTLVIVYSIKNTGKKPITGYSIVFSIDSREGNAVDKECFILQGEVLVEEASFELGEGIVIRDVQLSRLHIWSEQEERIYEY